MTKEAFDKSMTAIGRARTENLARLGDFAKALQTKVDALWERRNNVLDQIQKLLSLENPSGKPMDVLAIASGETEATVELTSGDLRDKSDRSKIVVAITNTHTKNTTVGETNRNREEFVINDLLSIDDANKAADEVRKLEDFVVCGEQFVEIYINRAMRMEAEQKKMLDNIIDAPTVTDGEW